MIKRVAIAVGLAMLVTSPLALSHHGTNISYDHSKPVTLTGTVTEFVWQNPHSQIYFDVKDARGVVHWAAEMNSPGVLSRQEGWTRRTVKAGDEITITLFPSKAGTPVGVAMRLEERWRRAGDTLELTMTL